MAVVFHHHARVVGHHVGVDGLVCKVIKLFFSITESPDKLECLTSQASQPSLISLCKAESIAQCHSALQHAKCHYGESHILFIAMMNVIMLSVILSFVMLSVVVPSRVSTSLKPNFTK
jgi:hypothetical protein